ncbi:hypothetical protein AR457_02385 [Streptomyces agglomeratus]|uniref:Methyltransferase domain-containing protein n=1 Tax=Streptomyces agglomeratus TaxID=285458 RepID=A0A1E5P1W4_9ACTN|nr:methyltransferase domain-containing protein [Streptomyces agglomeratus]OEJ23520.1 hypothetical protein AS594_02485 [Streptomyces agglomeratus]OEJ43114.1 hypothetical protein AR457_02385 [Streptomyces agglomeratus]OEJ54966.1 hypothetical protein BGK72_33395 [Streptomyces agglomeratus]OEJ62337.1 hypothetical protein BGM19_34315 [Streptomyces agglomeratus]
MTEPAGPASRCQTCGVPGGAYALSAEFYDILHAASYRTHAAVLAGPAAAARVGILELGAGTGLVTETLAGASSVPVHAVEPATAMRSVLLSRLAAADGLAGRVTVHACAAQDLDLAGQVDLVVCLRVIACLPPAERRTVWRTLAGLLVPEGLLFFDRPPARLPAAPRHHVLGEARVGADTYVGHLTEWPEDDRIRYVYTYLVRREDRVVRRAQEAFHLWPMTRPTLDEELAAAGFHVEDGLVQDMLKVRRLPVRRVFTGSGGHRVR